MTEAYIDDEKQIFQMLSHFLGRFLPSLCQELCASALLAQPDGETVHARHLHRKWEQPDLLLEVFQSSVVYGTTAPLLLKKTDSSEIPGS